MLLQHFKNMLTIRRKLQEAAVKLFENHVGIVQNSNQDDDPAVQARKKISLVK